MPTKNDPLYFLTSNTDCLYKKAPVGGVDIAIQHLCINELPLEAEYVVRQVNMWYSAHYFIVKYAVSCLTTNYGSVTPIQGRRSRSGWSGQNRTTFLDLKMLFGNGRYI